MLREVEFVNGAWATDWTTDGWALSCSRAVIEGQAAKRAIISVDDKGL
jgi:hypothetical protein